MYLRLIICLLCGTALARADQSVSYSFQTTAAPLQCYRALCEDWILRQWLPVKSAAFGGAVETPWRITLKNGKLEEGILKVMEPGVALSYTFHGNTDFEIVLFDFIPDSNGTTVKLTHTAPDEASAKTASAMWEERLPLLQSYLNSRPNSYLVKPYGDGRYPAILLLHDRFGLNTTIRDLADSLVTRGYVVLAVDMFRGDRTSDVAQARTFIELVQEENALRAVGSAWQSLLADSAVNRNRIGVVGLGYGGEMAMRVLGAEASFRAGVAWYPGTAPADTILTRIAAPLMILHAAPALDIPTPQAELMSKQLIQQGVRAETVLIKGDIGFAEPANGQAYSGTASAEAFRTMLGYLDRRLKV